jgi:hypothetical protein
MVYRMQSRYVRWHHRRAWPYTAALPAVPTLLFWAWGGSIVSVIPPSLFVLMIVLKVGGLGLILSRRHWAGQWLRRQLTKAPPENQCAAYF